MVWDLCDTANTQPISFLHVSLTLERPDSQCSCCPLIISILLIQHVWHVHHHKAKDQYCWYRRRRCHPCHEIYLLWLLSNLLHAHRSNLIFELTGRWNDNTKFFGFVGEFECIILRGNVDFCELFLSLMIAKDVVNHAWQSTLSLRWITLFSFRKSPTHHTWPSFFGMIKLGNAHYVAPTHLRTPISQRCRNSCLNNSLCASAIG